jgi:hypothetical protein
MDDAPKIMEMVAKGTTEETFDANHGRSGVRLLGRIEEIFKALEIWESRSITLVILSVEPGWVEQGVGQLP